LFVETRRVNTRKHRMVLPFVYVIHIGTLRQVANYIVSQNILKNKCKYKQTPGEFVFIWTFLVYFYWNFWKHRRFSSCGATISKRGFQVYPTCTLPPSFFSCFSFHYWPWSVVLQAEVECVEGTISRRRRKSLDSHISYVCMYVQAMSRILFLSQVYMWPIFKQSNIKHNMHNDSILLIH